ncbi:hypothetical protein TH25_08320 [Thalassospira profundimaris]|uniref:Lipoprotein n=1 Tax=Thalassospira profundimaris TaxID=502049 RepID=A0A367XG79_9PROT|nr:DUF3261 domain-containing protein [Thalassospira profundimaris]RCK51682.1 hypothetical protein TH25_08320 [Thalassospira profundimaris]
MKFGPAFIIAASLLTAACTKPMELPFDMGTLDLGAFDFSNSQQKEHAKRHEAALNAAEPDHIVALNHDQNALFVLPQMPWAKDANRVDVIQKVHATWQNGQSVDFQARISLAPRQVHMVMLDPMGRRAMQVNWSERGLSFEKADWMPDAFDPARMLVDIMMVYWPTNIVRDALPADMAMVSNPDNRQIVTIDEDGTKTPYSTITYPEKDRWQGAASLHNLRDGYQIDIQSSRIDSQ